MATEPEPCWDCRKHYWTCPSPDCHNFHCNCDRTPC